jgi:DNA-binding response OmpR family regulator
MSDNLVLIIDDDVWIQRILSKTIESYGFNTMLASNGFDGISFAVEHLPNLIILDILMPELSGHLTLKLLKHIKRTKHIPVLMVSAMSDTENLGLAVKSGTAGFISKPFTRATVFEKLISVFGQENIELISRGKTMMSNTEFSETQTNNQQNGSKKETIYVEITTPTNEQKQSPKQQVPSDQLLQHYQEDEKKSIESIKKLLLKTKK